MIKSVQWREKNKKDIFNGCRNSYVVASQKALDFDLLFKLNVITAVVEFITTVTLAIIYGDVIALAIGYLTGSVTGCILSFVIFKSRPNLYFSKSEFFRLFHFGKWVFSGGIVIFLILNMVICTELLVLQVSHGTMEQIIVGGQR